MRRPDGEQVGGALEVALSSGYQHIYRYLRRRLPRPSDAEDLAQDVCLRFVEVCRMRAVDSPTPYLMGIAHHVLADFQREAARERQLLRIDPQNEEALQTTTHGDPVMQRMSQEDLSRLMAFLPKTQHAVVTACCLEGRSYAEAATRLKLTVFTVEKYLTQAKAQMRAGRESRALKKRPTWQAV